MRECRSDSIKYSIPILEIGCMDKDFKNRTKGLTSQRPMAKLPFTSTGGKVSLSHLSRWLLFITTVYVGLGFVF